MTEKPPPRPPPRPTGGPPPLPKKAAPSGAAPPPRAAPPPLPAKRDDGGDTKLFSGNLGQEAELLVVQGEFQGKTIKLGAGTVVIGRSSECDLVLRAASGVSRRHCKVQYLGNRFVVVDLESRNGTIVNGLSVERKVLENGDKIEVGDELLQFVVHSLDDVRDAPVGDDAVHDAPTMQVPVPAQATPARGSPPAVTQEIPRNIARAPLEDGAPLPETLAPRSSPFLPADPAPGSPKPAEEKRGVGFFVFGAVAVVVVGGAAFLFWDLFVRDPAPAVALVDAGPAASTADAGTLAAIAPGHVDAGLAPGTRSASVDGGAVSGGTDGPGARVVDAGIAEVAGVDAGVANVANAAAAPDGGTPADAGATKVVRATASGRAEKVLVQVGDVVRADTAVALIEVDNPSLRRKLESLRAEERDFAEAAARVPSAKADLDAVRDDIRKLEARLRPQTQRAGSGGTVVEVLVRPGDVVRDGAPLLKLAGAP